MLDQQQNHPDLVYGLDENGKMGMVTAWPLSSIINALDLHVWRYSPEVDIDNDGKPDNIVLWHGEGADDRDVVCGAVYANIPDDGSVMQYAFFLDDNNKRVDEANTRRLFEGQSHSVVLDGKPVLLAEFPVVDVGIGIFEFRDQYYFDGSEFKFEKRGRTSVGDLQVYLDEDGQRTLTCEYEQGGLLFDYSNKGLKK